MSIEKYQTHPVKVEAVQVTGIDTAAEIVAWVTKNGGEAWDNSRFRPGGVAESAGVQVRGKDSQKRNADEGYWVVHMEDEFRIFTDEFFTSHFDSVKARHGASE